MSLGVVLIPLSCFLRLDLLGRLLLGRLLHLLLKFFDSSFDPWVAEGILGSHSFIRFPLEALVDEVDEVYLAFICLHHLRQVLRVNMPHFSLRIRLLQRPVVIVEEHLPPRRHHDHRPGWHTFDFHNALHLLFLVLTSEDWEADEEFVKDAAKGPHVNGWCVLDSHHDLGCTVES